jgi:hypothetical protein
VLNIRIASVTIYDHSLPFKKKKPINWEIDNEEDVFIFSEPIVIINPKIQKTLKEFKKALV